MWILTVGKVKRLDVHNYCVIFLKGVRIYFETKQNNFNVALSITLHQNMANIQRHMASNGSLQFNSKCIYSKMFGTVHV